MFGRQDMPWQIAIHENPAWRKEANFIIHAEIEQGRFEQIWARRLSEDRFRICCIPFFVYDLALGDEVETSPRGGMRYNLQRVVKPSTHYTFRVWFGQATDPMIRQEVASEARQLGCLFEWFSSNLMALDAPDHALAQRLASFLQGEQDRGQLTYETGLMSDRIETP